MPEVSIIIPVFNREFVLQETLDSVTNQTFSDWECILVDDGSTDRSQEICKNQAQKDDRFRCYVRTDFSENKGPSACRNIGIEKAKGKYAVFLDSDDLLAETCLENRISKTHQNLNMDAWIFEMQDFDEKGFGKICNTYPTSSEYTNETFLRMILRYQNPFSVTCPLWKLESLKKINGFDESFSRLEDPDLHARAFMNDFQFEYHFNQKADCFYRVDQNYHNRFSNDDFLKNYIFSFVKFYGKYLQFYEDQRTQFPYIKEELSKSLLLLFKDHLLDQGLGKQHFKTVLSFAKKHVMLSNSTFSSLRILRFYRNMGLDKLKGSGYHRLRNKTFKSLNERI